MNSILYSSPITVKSDTVVKAIATRTRYSRSNVCTHEVIMENSSNMILIFAVDDGDKTISLPVIGSYIPAGKTIRISWGDESYNEYTSETANDNTHTYIDYGEYRVSVSGHMEQFGKGATPWDNNGGDKLISVISFGIGLGLTSLSGAFNGCTALESVPLNAMPITITDFSHMLEGCSAFNASIGGWDTSNVIDMNSMFRGCALFNNTIGDWDTSNVEDMSNMFYGCTAFNVDISTWDTHNVEDMSYMFHDCTAFNQDVSWHSGLSWNISKVADMANFATGTCGIDSENIEEILRGAYELSLLEDGVISGVTFNSGNKPDYSDTSVQTYLEALEADNGWIFEEWRVPTPTFNPPSMNMQEPGTVEILCSDTGATIRYTTDGSTPTELSAVYSGSISITVTTTIKAIAYKEGLYQSKLASSLYSFSLYSFGDLVMFNDTDWLSYGDDDVVFT